jgi:membrane protein insertase, yidC/oxa1 family
MRIIVFPLTLKQEKSMKKMRELQPELEKIKEKYKDDPQEYQRKTAELYRESGVNPLGGCLPLLIQMPIFVALYWAFSGNAIPADAKFLWFTLKQPDRLFMMGKFAFNLLPVLNVGVTYIQQKIMTSATGGQENNQQMQTMMYMLPLMMLFIFYNMPSGVTLYYLVSGALSLVQQYFILKGRSDDGKDSIKGTK